MTIKSFDVGIMSKHTDLGLDIYVFGWILTYKMSVKVLSWVIEKKNLTDKTKYYVSRSSVSLVVGFL